MTELDYVALGKRIRLYRTRKKLTQEAVAESLNVAVSTISHCEVGTHKISLQNLVKLCNVLEVSLDDLLCDSLVSVRDDYVSSELQALISDCTPDEKAFLFSVLKSSIVAFRKYK